ncbi:MAG: HAD family phosphatase [Elusimicrobia bacterium]|nr:HAD family phosphatase [Elusimicrobiota bacterium]
MPDPVNEPVKAVFFDIGNVLVRFDSAGLMKDFALAAGSSPWRVARLVWSRGLVDDVERGRLSGRELYEAVREQTGYSGDYEDFRRIWCGRFRLDERAAALFRRLARRMPAYLLSNTNELHWEHIRRRYAFAREAAGAVLSFEAKARKPEAAIYEAAVRAAGAAPGECFFVDDSSENVKGARAAGLKAVTFKGAARLEKDAASLGLL